MVFKNPYGYLIKHFKLIHFILTGIYIYLAINTNRVLRYYNMFINNSASKLDAIKYINQLYLVFIIISVVICIIVYALMRYKKKPRLLYLILIGLYIFVGVMVNVSYRGLNTIYFSVLETKTLLLYRDLLNIVIWAQYISIVFSLVRAMGFDIKKFNFVNDLNDLHLDEKDTEEIELELGGSESVQRKFHRSLREFKYYYLENKAFIFLIFFVLLIVFFSGFFVNKEVINKVYNEGENVSTDNYRFVVLDTFITNQDYYGSAITNNDSMFVIVRMNIGTNQGAKVFKTSNLILKVNHHSYSVNNRYSDNFLDLGNGYKESKISNVSTYLFIYNVDLDDIDGKMILEYAGDKEIRLVPKYLDEVNNKQEFSLGQSIDFSKSTLGYGNLSISSYKIDKSFSYSYQYEVRGEKNVGNLTISGGDKYIMHLEMKEDVPYFDMYTFLSYLGKLKYSANHQEYVVNYSDKTPGSYKNGLYLLVDSNMENADSIWFEFRIRDSLFVYRLK